MLWSPESYIIYDRKVPEEAEGVQYHKVFLFGPQVQPKHVKEAFRLLNKSIIRVETPDINLDQEEEVEEEDEQQQLADGSEVTRSENL